MAKNGQKIDSLYLSIGLDVDQLQLDFDTAGKTVSQTMARLNSEIKQLKIKTSIDTSKLEGVGTDVDKVRVKEQALTRELQLQTQKMNILAAAYKSAKAQYGNDSGITRKAETALLGQQAAVEKLKASMRGLATEEKKIGAGSTGLARITAGASAARAGLDKVSGGYTVLSGKMLGVMAFASTGAGLFNITESAMMAGEKLYKLSTRLHTSTSEASKLNRVFQLSGTDINSVIPLFARLDKQFMSAGAEGNNLTLAMQQFGITLVDSSGNLLPITDQLDQLALGYKHAAEAGNEEAFTADILGARGAALIPLLQDYTTNMEIASQVKSTGLLNPQEAHKLYIQWQVMKAESGQLSMALGSALMPIAQDLMPEVTDGFKEMIEYIKTNKDDIKSGIEAWGSALKSVVSDATAVVKAVGDIGSAVKNNDISKAADANNKKHDYDEAVLEANGLGPNLNTASLLGGAVGARVGAAGGIKGTLFGGAVGAKLLRGVDVTLNRAYADATGSWEGMVANYNAQKQAAEEAGKATDANTDADNKNSEAAKKNAQAQYLAADTLKARQAATKALTDEIYSLTHSDLDNSLHAMQKTISDARSKGVDDETLEEYNASKSAEIYKKFAASVTQPMEQAFKTDLANQLAGVNQQAQQYMDQGASTGAAARWAAARKSQINAEWDRQVAEQIDSVWHSEYQNQLNRIENERKAWIQKGLDEVKAAEWAEQQKQQIQQKSAQDMLTSQRKYLEIYRNAIAAGEGQQGAARDIARQMREDKGISEGDFTSPGEIAGFAAAMKAAQDNLVPILSDSVYDGVKRAMIEVERGTSTSYESPSGRFQIDLGTTGQKFNDKIVSAGSALHNSVYSSSQAFYTNVSKSAGNMSAAADAAAKNIVDSSRLWTEKEAEAAHRYNNSLNDSPSLSTMAGKISRDPKIYGGMDPQRAIFNANIDPWNTKHIGQETMNAISEAMQMARGKVVPDNYEEVMPRSIRPEPRQNGRDRRYDDPDYTPRQGLGGSDNSPKPMANVTVNINNPVTVNEKTIQAQVAQGVDEGMSKVAEIINRTNKIDNY